MKYSKEVKEALEYIKIVPSTKNEMLMQLSSLTLISAAVKLGMINKAYGYSRIKPYVTSLVCYCIEHPEMDLLRDLYYVEKDGHDTSNGNCIYMRCLGVQFSYHCITVNEQISAFAVSPANKPVPYDAAYKQPRALGMYKLAKECLKSNISDEASIAERVSKLDWDYPQLLSRHLGEMADNGTKVIDLETILAGKFKVKKGK